jgi:hypothetical protein
MKYPHHSPSSLSQFLEYRDGWYLNKFHGVRGGENGNLLRGKAVEEGMNMLVKNSNMSEEQCGRAALELYRTECLKYGVQYDDDFARFIPQAVVESIKDLHFDSSPPILQHKISCDLLNVGLPIIGYLDFYMPNDKIVVDKKCTGRKPSELSQAYKIQGAIYKLATQCDVKFHFSVFNKTKCDIVEIPLEKDDFEEGIALAKGAARAIERILDCAEVLTREDMDAFFFPNLSASWTHEDKKARIEFWNISSLG